MNLSFGQLFKSKTFWTGLAGAAFNVWNQYQGHIDPTIVSVVNGAIALGVAVFRMFPSQQPPIIQASVFPPQ